MTEHLLWGIVSIIIFGVLAQWLAWRLSLPSILLLLIFGFVAGPVTGLLNPDEVLGDLLFPMVSAAVAIILFEGGLRLKFRELHQTGHIVRNLILIGAPLTWLLSTVAAFFLLDLEFPLALLFGAILIVTGPTVIIPLLRDVRVVDKIGAIVKWEGIVNDPLGAAITVLVFEAILVSGVPETAATVAIGLAQTLLDGLILGGLGALLLIQLFKRYWVPGYLQNGVTLMVVLAAFVASNMFQAESGLFTVTVMGVILANQKAVSVKHIIEFKENLGILLLSGLFIILAARLELADLTHFGWGSFAFLATLLFVVRPVSVWLATLRSGLEWREKLFLSWMAPRGIVAAAVTAVFAIELAERAGFTEAERMVPEMFLVIIGTVAVYGLSAAPLGNWLGVAQPNPQGILIVGAHEWARDIAAVLQDEGFEVLLVDNNWENINAARLAGLPTFFASILSEYALDEIELGSLGRLLALTPNDEVNSLAALYFGEIFDQADVYQLPPKETELNRKETVSQPLRGRFLFDSKATYRYLTDRFRDGATLKKTSLTEKFDYTAFQEFHGKSGLPLFSINDAGKLSVFTADDNDTLPKPGDKLISLVEADE